MLILFQLIAVCINVFIFLLTVHKLRFRLKSIYIVLLIFQAVFVLPIIFEWLFGIQDYSYKSPGFDKALNDTRTNVYYCCFVVFTSIVLYIFGIKNNQYKGLSINDIKDSLANIKINRELYIMLVLIMFLPLVLVFLSPSPEKYLLKYAYFQQYPDLASEAELWYHSNVLRIGGYISLLAIVVTKFFSKNNFTNKLVVYTAALITGILNGKRTLFAFIVLGILLVDIIKSPKGKIPYKKIVNSAITIIGFFVIYSFIIDKHTLNVNFIDNIRLYFFRDVDVKFSIYALLNPDEYSILDYWGQSYLFNFLFYIPRTLWINKPYPYDIYVTASSLGYPSGTVLSWNFQTSIFGEALSNLSIFGIPFSLVLINKFIKISERSENPIIILLCIFIITYSFMNHFGSYYRYFIAWLVLIIYNRFKNKKMDPQIDKVHIIV